MLYKVAFFYSLKIIIGFNLFWGGIGEVAKWKIGGDIL